MKLNLETIAGLKGILTVSQEGQTDDLVYFVHNDNELLVGENEEPVAFLGDEIALSLFLAKLLGGGKFSIVSKDVEKQTKLWEKVVTSPEEIASGKVHTFFYTFIKE